MMEYHCTKRPDISIKIFDMGMKQFGDDPNYAIKYLSFLLSINDEASMHLFSSFIAGS
jgi:cleavage stimulation factor subunit 3